MIGLFGTWLVDEWNRRYVAGENPSAMGIKKDFNVLKYHAFPWMREIHRDAHADAFERLGRAWGSHFKNPKQRGRPAFHKKGHRDSFYVANDRIGVSDRSVCFPVVGWVRMCEELRFAGKIMRAVVSRTADRWFVSISVEVGEIKKQRTSDGVVGADVGIKNAVALSTGEKIDGPKPLAKVLRKLKRLGRKASRQTRGGKNQKKTYAKIARVHARVANIRNDFWHKITTRLCRENQAIAIESLNVKGMARNKKLARALADISFGMMRPMLEYKSKMYDTLVVSADQWHPSSKTCSNCGCVKEKLSLSERLFICEACGFECDRDVNAARNLESLIPAACGIMPADWERLVKAPREAGTSRPCVRQGATSVAL